MANALGTERTGEGRDEFAGRARRSHLIFHADEPVVRSGRFRRHARGEAVFLGRGDFRTCAIPGVCRLWSDAERDPSAASTGGQ